MVSLKIMHEVHVWIHFSIIIFSTVHSKFQSLKFAIFRLNRVCVCCVHERTLARNTKLSNRIEIARSLTKTEWVRAQSIKLSGGQRQQGNKRWINPYWSCVWQNHVVHSCSAMFRKTLCVCACTQSGKQFIKSPRTAWTLVQNVSHLLRLMHLTKSQITSQRSSQ